MSNHPGRQPDPPRQRFALIVTDDGAPGTVPLWNRLRSFLKIAKRAFSIRAVRCVELNPDGSEKDFTPDGAQNITTTTTPES